MMMLRRMKLRRKTDPKTEKQALCEHAQWKCTQTFHNGHFVWNRQEKCGTPIQRHPSCASMRGGNACGHFTRAILWN